MSVETWRNSARDGDRSRARFLVACAALRTCAANRWHHRRKAMNVSAELLPILADVQKRFSERLDAVDSPRANEIYFHAKMDLVAGFCAHLYRKWNARLVSLFGDDAREADGAFHLYYVFALDAAHGFFILRVPV